MGMNNEESQSTIFEKMVDNTMNLSSEEFTVLIRRSGHTRAIRLLIEEIFNEG